MAAEERPDQAEVKVLGKYIVSDPQICHGKLTIRGTRILVSVVLEQVVCGLDWDTIVEGWHGRVPREAISEAVLIARDALLISTNEDRTAAAIGLKARG